MGLILDHFILAMLILFVPYVIGSIQRRKDQ